MDGILIKNYLLSVNSIWSSYFRYIYIYIYIYINFIENKKLFNAIIQYILLGLYIRLFLTNSYFFKKVG